MNKSQFINREISWLAFNKRVLCEATDENNPLMERLKFAGIFSSNLDEFFMIRVAGIKEQILYGYSKEEISGLNPKEQIKAIKETASSLLDMQQEIYKNLQKDLIKYKIIINPKDKEDLEDISLDIFTDKIMSVITPVTIDPAHPFPFIFNKRLTIISELEKKGKKYYSLIMLPENMNRFFTIRNKDSIYILMAEDIIKRHICLLYRGFNVNGSYVFRLTRNADQEVQEDEASDLLQTIQDFISRRHKGFVTRIEVEPNMPRNMLEYLKSMIDFNQGDIYKIDGTIDLTFLFNIAKLNENMLFAPFNKFQLQNIPNNKKIFDRIKEKDIFFYRPYYTFSLVSSLISIAANDDDVLAIKMTLYRTNKDSSILASLVKAAKSGKQVSVVIELKARFDEERNISWARNLEEAGCIVTYGIVGLKIHAKCLLIVRREKDSIKRYTHIATGNYNENTAELYTDVDLITADDNIGKDAAMLFNYLMSYTDENNWNSLFVAPFNLRKAIEDLLEKEKSIALKGEKSVVIMKMNSLIDENVIKKMYEASQAGVKIHLIIRGICGLKAGVKGLSENITVTSIVGRFLEHARIFYFSSNGEDKFFISSADMMPRNINRRVELMTEIKDNDIKKSLMTYLNISMQDNKKAWILKNDTYFKKEVQEGEKEISSQEWFMNNRLI